MDTQLTRDGKTYWWCDHLNVWAQHEPKDCRVGKQPAKKATKDSTLSKGAKQNNQQSALSIARALIAVSDATDEDPEDSDKE